MQINWDKVFAEAAAYRKILPTDSPEEADEKDRWNLGALERVGRAAAEAMTKIGEKVAT